MNRVDLIGFLGRDPETRTFGDGSKVVNIRLATTERWRDRNTGETRETTEWHSVAVFGPLADVVARLRKGSRARFTGKLRTRKWQDQNGQDRYATEVVLQGPRAEFEFLDRNADGGDGAGRSGPPSSPPPGPGIEDDEIPF